MIPHHRDIDRIDGVIRRLFNARDTLPSVRATVDDYIADALDLQGGSRGSGISDPTGASAARITKLQERHRRLTEAVGGLEKAVAHLLLTAEGCLSAPPRHDDGSGGTDAPTCPVMVLKGSVLVGRDPDSKPTRRPDGSSRSEVLVRCGNLTAHKIDEHGNPIGYDTDGYCADHRAEVVEAKRAAHAAVARKTRRVSC